ncbi:phospholipid carrier-dependent glycosyltransferase [Actinoplanes sp. NPDC049265]|uniref:phospholipid carrier-dependent glycosyltransferase n=1 Tax=Actinoplanes sp. NPDC049265 TaxID=3363902 RepID=UPI0037166419
MSVDVARPRTVRSGLVVLVLLGQMAVAMLVTAVGQTPTIDEPVYAGTAVTYLEWHSLRYNPEHPPLGKLIIAAGLSIARPQLDPGFRGDQTELGRHVLYESGNDPGLLMLLARLPVMLLTLLFGVVVFVFARDLTNPVGAVLALTVYAFDPDVITHGSLATLDVPAAGFLLTAVWLTWRAHRSRPWTYLALAGAALGAALAVRASVLPAVAVVLILARRRFWVVGAVATAVVWLSYLAVDPGLSWTPPPDLPDVHGLRGVLVDLLPFPQPYRDGMRIQFGFEDNTFSGFLFGHRYVGSRWYYLPVALLVKTPLALLVVWAASAVAMLVVPRLRSAAGYVLAAPALLLVVSMTGARNYGTRYVVCLPIFLAVAVAALTVVGRRWVAPAAGTLAALVAASSLAAFPYYLPYANEAFGGPARTHLYLHDSNVDWGQDLGRLARHLRTRYPGEPVWLVYKGAGVPSAYGISAGDPLRVPSSEVHGLLVVSDSAVAKATGRLSGLLATSGEPIDEVGHSMSIYRRR